MNRLSSRRLKSYWEGYDAIDDFYFDENPYVPSEGVVDFEEWEDGWLRAFYEKSCT